MNSGGLMERRFSFLRQSSLAPVKPTGGFSKEESTKLITAEQLDATLQLLFFAYNGDVEGVRSVLEWPVNVDSADFDSRTALHVAACEDKIDVVNLLLGKGANVNAEDRWGSTPLADARHYGNIEICNVLEQNGGKMSKEHRNSLMRIPSSLIPEYEIDQSTLKFDCEQPGKKVDKYRAAMWNGTKVWVYFLSGIRIATDDNLVDRFRDQLALLLKLRHPNVVQFLGAVTQTSPMMIVTEFLPGGNLKTYLEENKRLEQSKALPFALDIARGLNCLHEHKPDGIVHGDLKPSNLLLVGSKHIKVANFGLSRSLREESSETILQEGGSVRRYMAPELYKDPSTSDLNVDVFSFGIILQELFEGQPPFPELKEDGDVAKEYCNGKRPPFRHGGRRYPPNLKELIMECWATDPSDRPPFSIIIQKLTQIKDNDNWRTRLKTALKRSS